MSGSKRSWETMVESDDDEEPSMGRQTLPVARLSESFTGEPMDGMQYLFTVRRDSKKLPFVTRVANPFNSVPLKVETEKSPALGRIRVPLPSEEWRAEFLKRFKNFRKNSTQPTIGVQLPFIPSPGRPKLMPDKKERDNWWAFINGRPEREWNPPKKPKKSKQDNWNDSSRPYEYGHRGGDLEQYEVSYSEVVVEEPVLETLVVNEYGEVAEGVNSEPQEVEDEITAGSLPTPFATPQPETRYKSTDHKTGGPQQPTPVLLKAMDSRYCLHLLMYFTHWITQHLEHLASPQPFSSTYAHLTQNHAQWMFVLLSRVGEQLLGDDLSSLRALARACIAFIKDLNKNNALGSGTQIGGLSGVRWVGNPADAPMDERACWIVVSTITDFWGQKDLLMDAESTLNGS